MKRIITNHSGISTIFGIIILIILIWAGLATYFALRNIAIEELLKENKYLKECISRITKEEQIGYAKVIRQYEKDNKLYTILKFVETSRNDPSKIILQKEYTIEGDIIHFDAMIIKFSNELVLDGKERAIYLWRRVYGENTAPSKAFPIEEEEKEPERYKDIFEKLGRKEKEVLWSSIWELSNDPNKLKKLGIEAIFGNAIYSKLKPGMVYIFRIDNTGQLSPEIVPDF